MMQSDNPGRAYATLAALVIAALSASCASVRYKEFHADSRLPLNSVTPVCMAPGAGKLFSLNIGQGCYVQVRAESRISRVPLQVRPNERYRLAMLKNQAWFDKGHRVSTAEGFKGTLVMNTLKDSKRSPESNWMALSVMVVDAPCSESTVSPVRSLSNAGTELAIAHTGQLAFFPNDVYGWHDFYKNNRGMVWIEVTRQTDSGPVENVSLAGCMTF